MITITGPYHTSSGALVNGFVRFRPYPYSENQGTGKVISTTLVDGREKTVEFSDGEPVDTLTLYQGTYEVLAPLTKTQRIAVPAGTATKAIAELITTGIANPPTAGAGIPAGGTTGQVIVKSSSDDYDADWDDPPAGTPASTVVEETGFGQAAAVGSATAYARADHTHGTPATPSAADVGADATGTAAAAVSAHAGGTGVHAIASTTGLQTALDGKAPSGLVGEPVELAIAVSDETSDLTTGNGKATFRMPFAMTATEVRASVTTAPSGAILQADINETGTTILSTVLSIDAGEKTSTTAATPAVISDGSLADDAEISIDIDQVGSVTAGAGLKITIIGTRA